MTGASKSQTTAMGKSNTSKIDPMRGVVKPEELKKQIRACVAGNGHATSYLFGARKFLIRHPPNPYIVPLLTRAMEKAREV